MAAVLFGSAPIFLKFRENILTALSLAFLRFSSGF